MSPPLRALVAVTLALLVLVAAYRIVGAPTRSASSAPTQLAAVGNGDWRLTFSDSTGTSRALYRDDAGWWLDAPGETPVDDTLTRSWDARFAQPVPVLEARPLRTTGHALGVTGPDAVSLHVQGPQAARRWSLGRVTPEGDTWIHDGGRFVLRVAGNWRDAWDAPREALRSRDVFRWERDDVHAVSWQRDGVSVRLERGTDGEWRCTQRVQDAEGTPCDQAAGLGPMRLLQPVDSQEVHAWLGVLSGLRAVEVRPRPAAHGPDWLVIETARGMDRVAIVAEGGPPEIALAGVDGAFVLRSSSMQRVQMGLDGLRDRMALSTELSDIAGVSVRREGTGWMVQCDPPRSADAPPECYTITGYRPPGTTPELQLARAVSALRVVDWVSNADPVFAMGPNPDRVLVHLRQGGTRTILLGVTDPPLAADPDAAIRFARVDDGPIFRLDARTLAVLMPLSRRSAP